MEPISKIEMLYRLYVFGCKRQIVTLSPFVVFPVDRENVPSFEVFKRDFIMMLHRRNTTEELFYKKVQNAIKFLVQHDQLNFRI